MASTVGHAVIYARRRSALSLTCRVDLLDGFAKRSKSTEVFNILNRLMHYLTYGSKLYLFHSMAENNTEVGWEGLEHSD